LNINAQSSVTVYDLKATDTAGNERDSGVDVIIGTTGNDSVSGTDDSEIVYGMGGG